MNNHAIRFLQIFSLLFLFADWGICQERMSIPFQRIYADQGLSRAEVTDILQDRKGYMWFATKEGLDRYDGYHITSFQHDTKDPNSLPVQTVVSLAQTGDGVFWVAGENSGIAMGKPGSWTHFEHDPTRPESLPGNHIKDLYADRMDRVWVATADRGLALFKRGGQTVQTFTHDPADTRSLGNNNLRAITGEPSGMIWIGTTNSLERFDPIIRTFERFCVPLTSSCDAVTALAIGAEDELWVGTANSGLFEFDRKTKTFQQIAAAEQFGPSGISAITTVRDGSVWAGGESGLIKWDPEMQKGQTFRKQSGDASGLNSNFVQSLYQDRGGVLWVGTDNGLSKWNVVIGTFAHYKPDPNNPKELNKNQITSFAEDHQDGIWVGTFGGGLERLDLKTDTFTRFRASDQPGSLSDNRVMTVYHDSQNRLWAGTFGGLNRLDPETDRFVTYSHDPSNPKSLGNNAISSILEDRRGRIWVGLGRGGLSVLDTETDEFDNYKHQDGDPESLGSNNVMVIFRDRGGVIWLGTQNAGLDRYNLTRNNFDHFRNITGDPHSLSSNGIWAICEDRFGNLWIGTEGGGLEFWRQEDRKADRNHFKHYTTREGLPSADVYAILEDNDGMLWLSSNKGLTRFNPKTESFRNYDTTRGLQDMEFNSGAALKTGYGRMYFGGVNGFNAFRPDWIKDNEHQPAVVITRVLEMDHPLEATRIKAGLDFSHRQTMISFEFAALDYTAPARNRYQYKLEGFDDEWVKIGHLRRATYTNLDAGDYTFRVKASNNDGIWNEEGASLSFTISPPFWWSVWAWTGYGLMLVFLFIMFKRSHARKLDLTEQYSRRLEAEVAQRVKEMEAKNSELEKLNAKLMETGLTDPLTGLRNRKFLQKHFQEEMTLEGKRLRAHRHGGLLFFALDLDHFKKINEQHGHNAGDLVLIQMRQLLEALPFAEMIVRLSGDEFLVTAKGSRMEEAVRIAAEIVAEVSKYPFDPGNNATTQVTCTVGFGFYPFSPAQPGLLNWEQALGMAERALYIAKNNLRNNWLGIGPGNLDAPGDLTDRLGTDIDGLIRDHVIRVATSLPAQQPINWN